MAGYRACGGRCDRSPVLAGYMGRSCDTIGNLGGAVDGREHGPAR